MRKCFIILVMFSAFALTACKEDEEEFSLAPVLSFVSISPESAGELVDPVEITINYYDEDGDLGENNAALKNLFVVDSRNEVTYEFRIQQLAPSGSTIPIEGSLTINIDPLVISDGSASQTASFIVYCKDRAGNLSNSVTTTEITISE